METDEHFKKVIMLQTKEEIIAWLDLMYIVGYTINDNFTVDVVCDVYLNGKNLTKIPVQFNKVKGYFDCRNNKLISLKGCPKIIIDNDIKFNLNGVYYYRYIHAIGLECDDYLKSSPEYKAYKLLKALTK